MTRALILIIFFLQGWLMATVVKEVEVDGVKSPVIFERDNSLPIISLEVVFQNSGSIQDKEKPGLAKMTSGIFEEGTKSLGATKFASILDDNALHLNIANGNETFTFELSSLKEKFGLGLKELKDLLSEPNLTNESLEKVKTLMLSNISSKENDFDYIANLGLKKLLFNGTPLGHAMLGNKESISKIDLEDIKNFIDSHVVRSRAIIIIGGDLTEKEALKYAKDILSTLKKGTNDPLGFYNASDKEKTEVIKKDTKQAYVYFGAPFYLKVNDKDAYKSKVAAFILGSSGFGSRLMEKIRVQEGLAYSVYARVNLNKSYSDFSGYLQTKVETKDKAVELVKKVIEEFIKNGANEDELKSAKEFLSGSEPLRVETLSQRLNRAFFEYYRGLKLGYSLDELKLIEKLNLKELNDFIKKHPEILKLSFSIVTK